MTKKNLMNQVEKLKELKAQKNSLEHEIEQIEECLKKEMAKKNLETLQVGENTLRYKTMIVNQFNAKAFKESYHELYTRFVLPVARTRFTLS